MNAQQVLSQFQATGVQTCFHGRHINPQIYAGLDGINWRLKDYEARDGYKALRKIYMETHQYDKAWCICNTLSFLKKTDPEEQQLYEQYKPKGFVRAKQRITDDIWKKVFHPDQDRYVGAIFGAVWQGAALVRAFPFKQYEKSFGLKRKDETGLSLAILRPDPDLTPEALAASVIRQYFLALVSGRLNVTVEFPGGHYDLNRHTVDRLAGSLPVGPSVSSWLSLARAATNPGIVVPVVNRKPEGAPKWEHCDIDYQDPHDLRRRFERGEVIAFSVPITVRPAGAAPRDSSMR